MKKQVTLLCVCLGLMAFLAAGPAQALSFPITFSEFPVGTLEGADYLPLGILFTGGTVSSQLPIIANDSAMPNSPVLSPNPTYAGDFNINFLTPVTYVKFDSGYWDMAGTGVIEAFDATHTKLGPTLTNLGTGVETFTLSGLGPISYIYFNSDKDPAGADIDNLTTVPLPPSALLLGTGLLGLAWLRRSKRS
jgi:hypothetical protein